MVTGQLKKDVVFFDCRRDHYQIRALTRAGLESEPAVASASASWTFFDVHKLNTLITCPQFQRQLKMNRRSKGKS